jgi:hypothetical protein
MSDKNEIFKKYHENGFIRNYVRNLQKKQVEAFTKLINYTGDLESIDTEANVSITCDVCGINRKIKLKDAKNTGFINMHVMRDSTNVDFFILLCNGCKNRRPEIKKRIEELRQTGKRKINYGL